MHPDSTGHTSRRDFVATSAAALATLWLTADPRDLDASGRHAALAAARRVPIGWEALGADEAADVDAIAAQIIPTDATPGAREAHVVNFIDHSLANWAAAQRPDFVKGLAVLNAEVEKRWPGTGRFAKLATDHQREILTDWEKEKDKDRKAFFEAVRTATIAGMFSNPSYGGNADQIGWKLIGFDDRGVWQPPFGSYDDGNLKGGR
jgi:gluconate 2-dehydrogenase gamma chain